jgi:hypothetical protein
MRRLDTPALAPTLLAVANCLLAAASANAERFNDSLEPNDSNWSNPGNWVDGLIADNNTKIAEISFGDPVVDANYTVRDLRTVFSTTGALISGPGTLTIDRNAATTTAALLNQSGQGAVLAFDGSLTIKNTLEGRTVLRNANSASNVIRFNSTSVLTLETGLEIQTGSGGLVDFNGSLAGPADLFFNSNNSIFGTTADNTGYEGDLVFFANALAVSNLVGGRLVESGSKVQVNGNGSRMEINGSETFFGSVNVGGPNNFTFDADADQSSMGVVAIADGVLTIDVDSAVTQLAFANSSAEMWGAGSVSIVGFKENTVRFGTDASGLTLTQLAAIDGGIYSLNSQGYLTTMSAPSLFGDYNEDGKVDAADYTVWRDNQNGNQPLPNDNELGTPIGAAHYSLWAGNYGDSAPSATAIPEPGAMLLTVGALLVGCSVARRSSRRTPSETHTSGVGTAF